MQQYESSKGFHSGLKLLWEVATYSQTFFPHVSHVDISIEMLVCNIYFHKHVQYFCDQKTLIS